MEEKKHTPKRTCLACFKKYEKSHLLAIIKQNDGSMAVIYPLDRQSIFGRSIYLCPEKKCILSVSEEKKKRFVESRLQAKIPEKIWQELLEWNV